MNLLNDLEDLGFDTKVQFNEFLRYFIQNYPHLNSHVSGPDLEEFLKQPHIRRSSIEKKADFFSDYILSQGLCDVME